MATSSFDKHFILKTPEEVERFYESFNKEPRKFEQNQIIRTT